MRTVLLTLLATAVLVVLSGMAFLYSGIYDVSATHPHWPITRWAMERVRTFSIKAQAAVITPPPGMMEEAKLLDGTEHFAAHCVACHGAPSVPHSAIAN